MNCVLSTRKKWICHFRNVLVCKNILITQMVLVYAYVVMCLHEDKYGILIYLLLRKKNRIPVH